MKKTPKRPKTRALELLTRSELARRAGVTRQAVAKAARGALVAAVRGDRIDAGHPDVVAWLTSGHRTGAKVAPEAPQADEIRSLNLRKKKAEVASTEMKTEVLAGRLVSRELVQRLCYSHLQTLHMRLLRDCPARLRARFGAEVGDAVASLVSTELALAKRATMAGLHAAIIERSPPPVTEAEAPDHDAERRQGIHAMAAAAIARLDSDAAAKIVELTAKALARSVDSSAGELFDRVIAAVQPAAADVTSSAATILRHHITEAARLTTEITKEPEDAPELHA